MEAALSFKTLSKAPIKEALIGIRVESADSALSLLEGALAALPDDFQTQREPITLTQTQIAFGPGAPPPPNVQQRQLGWRFGSKGGKYAVQARTDWLIFSHLPPYSEWPKFSEAAEEVWQALSTAYKPTDVRAVTVRNINEVNVGAGENIEKYLKFYINVPEGVPQQFKNYFARIELHHSQNTIVVLQSGLLSRQVDSAQLLLDIELVKTVTPKDRKNCGRRFIA